MPLGSLRGDTDKLGALRKGLGRLGDHGYRYALTLVASRAIGTINRGFASSTDPNGAPWAPTVAGNKPLIRTGALQAQAARVTTTSRGLRVSLSLPYAGFHLTGTRDMPARPYLPDPHLARLPPLWRDLVEASMRAVLALYLPPP